MSTTNPTPTRVQAPVLGQNPIEAVVEDSFLETTITHGPRRVFRVSVEDSTYRVLEADCIPL